MDWQGSLKELAPLLPAMLSGASGNPEALSAFMEGYQRTRAQLDERRRAQSQEALQADDRQRQIARQTEQDRVAAEQRAIEAEDRRRRLALERVQIGPTLAELGSAAETPAAAEQTIDAAFAQLQEAFGGAEALAPSRDVAINLATQTITAKQRAQVQAFLDKALGTEFVAQSQDHDPMFTADILPEHVQRILGTPTARLSELQRFARLPIGRPARKMERPMSVSGRLVDPESGRVIYEPPREPDRGPRQSFRWIKDRAGNVVEWPSDQPAPRGSTPYDTVGARQTARQTAIHPQLIKYSENLIRKVDDLIGRDDDPSTPENEAKPNRITGMTTGIGGTIVRRLPWNTSARDVDAELFSLTSELAIAALQKMRASSMTGAGVGNVALGEMEIMKNAEAAIRNDQSPANLRRQLAIIRDSEQRFLDAVRQDQRASESAEPAKATVRVLSIVPVK